MAEKDAYALRQEIFLPMKATLLLAFSGLILFPLTSLRAETPAGEVLELHGCELYTGGCTASGQITQGGRTLLRVWHFSSGSLSGLNVALLEKADANLALPQTEATASLAYLPASANAAQREALLGWLRENGMAPSAQKVAAIRFDRESERATVKIGDAIQVSTRAMSLHCDAGGCGESLWYAPRSRAGEFSVAVNESSSIEEPALKLSWRESNVKSVFLAKFGAADAKPVFKLAALD